MTSSRRPKAWRTARKPPCRRSSTVASRHWTTPSVDDVLAATQFLDQMVELDGEADAEHVSQAGTGQAEPRREADPHVPGQLPAEHRREVVRSVAKRQRPAVSDTPVGFSAGNEFLSAEDTRPACRTMQGTRCCHRIPKLPGCVRQISPRDSNA